MSLVVRPNRAGEPIWSAAWRDSTRKAVNRTVGKAWLVKRDPPRNPFSESDQRRPLKDEPRAESWRTWWEKRSGRSRDGALDVRTAQALARERVVEREVEILRAQRAQEGAPQTFGQLADLWLQERRAEVADEALKASTYRDYASMLARFDAPMRARGKGREDGAHIMRAFEDARLEDITGRDVEAFERALRGRGLSPSTRRKYRVVMRMILDHAVQRGWLDRNPMSMQRQKHRKPREKALTVYDMATVQRIATEAGGMVGEAIRLAALTGLRQGELLALRWADIDFPNRSVTVSRTHIANVSEDGTTKSGKTRTVPMSDQAAVVLDRLSRRDKFARNGDLVFANAKGEHLDASWLRRRYAQARDVVIAEAAQEGDMLPVGRWHDLRHTFGTRMAAAGEPLIDLKT